MQAGDALSSLLPDHVGGDSFKANYSQAFIPGLVTALRGIRYEPCLLRSSVLGAGASAAGVVFNPELFATRPTGAGRLPHSEVHFNNAALAAECGSRESRTSCYKYIPREGAPNCINAGRRRTPMAPRTPPASHIVPYVSVDTIIQHRRKRPTCNLNTAMACQGLFTMHLRPRASVPLQRWSRQGCASGLLCWWWSPLPPRAWPLEALWRAPASRHVIFLQLLSPPDLLRL